MITVSDIKAFGFKELDRGDDLPPKGYFYLLQDDDIVNYKLWVIRDGRVYATTTKKLTREKFGIADFLKKVQQDIQQKQK